MNKNSLEVILDLKKLSNTLNKMINNRFTSNINDIIKVNDKIVEALMILNKKDNKWKN